LKVLVTGGAGYLGSVLIRSLLEVGYDVVCLDMLLFGRSSIESLKDTPKFKLVEADTRTFNPKILENVDIAIDLAAIAQPDPLEKLSKKLFHEINYLAPVRVAKLSKEYGIKKYIFPSTCSVYGFKEEISDETSSPNPIDNYAKTKVLAEKMLSSLCNKDFSVTFMRFSTLYGLSPKMRFDLVLNGMTLALFTTGKIKVMRDGTQWRPIVHVKDAVRAIIKVLEVDIEKVRGEIFNVGSNEQNFQIYSLAKLIGEAAGVDYDLEWYGEPDTRSYRVKFDKINQVLGFKTIYTPQHGVKEIFDGLQKGIIKDEPSTRVINWCTQLVKEEKLKVLNLPELHSFSDSKEGS
jgi:nucleoside-diphosphate-sugar epimerase